MSIEVDDLHALSRAYDEAGQRYFRLGQKLYPGFSAIERAATAPLSGSEPEYLDAWADYAIAKRRYERALIISRRGEVE